MSLPRTVTLEIHDKNRPYGNTDHNCTAINIIHTQTLKERLRSISKKQLPVWCSAAHCVCWRDAVDRKTQNKSGVNNHVSPLFTSLLLVSSPCLLSSFLFSSPCLFLFPGFHFSPHFLSSPLLASSPCFLSSSYLFQLCYSVLLYCIPLCSPHSLPQMMKTLKRPRDSLL